MKQARTGLELLGRKVISETIDGAAHWSVPAPGPARKVARRGRSTVYLLPNYDELMNALRDRGLFQDSSGPPPLGAFAGFPHQLVIDGVLRGAWRRTLTARAVSITVKPFRPLSRHEKTALADAVARHGTFMELPAALVIV